MPLPLIFTPVDTDEYGATGATTTGALHYDHGSRQSHGAHTPLSAHRTHLRRKQQGGGALDGLSRLSPWLGGFA